MRLSSRLKKASLDPTPPRAQVRPRELPLFEVAAEPQASDFTPGQYVTIGSSPAFVVVAIRGETLDLSPLVDVFRAGLKAEDVVGKTREDLARLEIRVTPSHASRLKKYH